MQGGLQIAAERNDRAHAGVIRVINMMHDGYKEAKKEYFNLQ